MERSRDASGGRENPREWSGQRAGGGPFQERSREESRELERGSSRREDSSRNREAEGRNLRRGDPRGDSRDSRSGSKDSRGDYRDSKGREWGRAGTNNGDRSSRSVSTKVEAGSENKDVWEAPMPGEWQPTKKSGVPSWDKAMLKEEENPPDWVEPPQPKVDLSLSPYKEEFEAEAPYPPVTPIENKEELLGADNIPEDDPVVVLFARGYVRTTRRGLKESKRAREDEEREVYEMLKERGFFSGRGRGGRGRGGRGRGGSQRGRRDDQGGFNPNLEPVAGSRGFGGSRDRRDGGREGDRGSRDRAYGGAERSSRQERDDVRGNSRVEGSGSAEKHRDASCENRQVRRDSGENRRRDGERSREGDRPDSRREGSGSCEARRGGERGYGGSGERGDFSGKLQGGQQESKSSGSVSSGGGSKPREAQSYKEWKDQQKRKSAGQ